MLVRKILLALFLILSFIPLKGDAQTPSKAGFVRGSIWYSKDPFEEGDKIKIYTAVFNPEDKELSGDVIFFDKTTYLDKKHFIAPAKGIVDVSMDWIVTIGGHRIFGKIENAKFKTTAGTYEETYITENKTEEDPRTVEKKIVPKEPVVVKTKTENQITSDIVVNDTPSTISGVVNNGINFVKNIGTTVKEVVPPFVIKPVAYSTNALETFRTYLGTHTENKKVDIKNQIEVLKTEETQVKEKNTTSKVIKPLKLVELFALSLFSFTFNNAFIFYGLLILALLLLLRYVWRLIF